MNSEFLMNFHYTPDGAMTRADALCGFIKDEIAYGRLKAGIRFRRSRRCRRRAG